MAAMNFPNGPSLGDKYPVTPIVGQPQYTWDGEKWTTVGSQISNATPSAAVPLMDATPGLPGSAAAYSRGDHVHPTDTTRAALSYVDANMVGYAAQTTTANQKAQARANVNVTKKNYIINGGMMISQENGTTAGTTSPYFPIDQFFIQFGNGGATSVAQVASRTPSGSTNRIRITATTADAAVAAADYSFLCHRIEGTRAADLNFGGANAKTITLQFGCKAPAGTYCVAFRNSGTTRTYFAEYVIAAGEANTDVVKSITIPGDTAGAWLVDNTLGLEIMWTLMAGSNFAGAGGVWGTVNGIATANQFNFMGTINNVFELFDVSLTEGSIAPPFQLPDYASELLLCQRYWRASYPLGTKPGTAWTTNTIIKNIGTNTIVSGTYYGTVEFPVPMRGTPTVNVYGCQGTANAVSHGGGIDLAATTGTPFSLTASNFAVWCSGAGATTSSYSVQFHYVANTRL